MECISKVTYPTSCDATLMAGVEYANSLSCDMKPEAEVLPYETDLRMRQALKFYTHVEWMHHLGECFSNI